MDSSGNSIFFNCGGVTHWVHKIDWSTGYPVWSGKYGSSSLNSFSNQLVLHPTLELFCGFIAFREGLFGTNCDLDFTATINRGDSNPSPGNSNNFWSLFPFCQNVSSDSGVLPPAWTHTISSSGTDGGATWVDAQQNGWGGNNVLIQVVSRGRGSQPTQGLQWPATGTTASVLLGSF